MILGIRNSSMNNCEKEKWVANLMRSDPKRLALNFKEMKKRERQRVVIPLKAA